MKALGYAKEYKYPHDFPYHFTAQQYFPEGMEGLQFYHPTQLGQEKEIARRLEWYRKHGAETDSPEGKSVREQDNGKEDREESLS